MRPVLIGFVLLAILSAINDARADAGAVTLTGNPAQGALVVGRAAAGSTVTLDGKQIQVSPSGVFVLGFSRNSPDTAQLVVQAAGGKNETRTLQVRQRAWKIQRIKGLAPGKVTPNAVALARIGDERAEIIKARAHIGAGIEFADGFGWPLNGRISGVYGSQRILNGKPRRPHYGVDIAAPEGTDVHASAAGRVTLAHQGMFFTGKTIILDHGHGVTTLYSHLSALLVKAGASVARGQIIGRVGMTGRATGPHLHWGLNLGAMALDPALAAGPRPAGNAVR